MRETREESVSQLRPGVKFNPKNLGLEKGSADLE